MGGGMIDGALNAVIPQDEPTPEPNTDESASTPTPEPALEPEPTDEPAPEPTQEPEITDEPESTQEPEATDEPVSEPTQEPEATNEPEPTAQNASENVLQDYAEQIAAIQETLTVVANQNAQLIDLQRTNGFLLAFILAALLSHIFWRRILR